MQQLQAWIHHAQPFIVTKHVLLTNRIAVQTLPHHPTIDIVVVAPVFVAGVIRRINKDAVHFASIARQQRFKSVEMSPWIMMFSDLSPTDLSGCGTRGRKGTF